MPYESSTRPPVFDAEDQLITCVWCVLKRPRSFAEHLVLAHHRQTFIKTGRPVGEGRDRTPTRRRR